MKCFSCGVSGDAIEIFARLHKLSFLDSATTLARKLGIDTNTEVSNELRAKIAAATKAREAEREAKAKAQREATQAAVAAQAADEDLSERRRHYESSRNFFGEDHEITVEAEAAYASALHAVDLAASLFEEATEATESTEPTNSGTPTEDLEVPGVN